VKEMSLQEKFLQQVDALSGELIELTQELVQRKSENPPGDEREVAEFVASEFQELGLHVECIESQPKRVNAIGILQGTSNERSLLFNGHYDTVPIGDVDNWSVEPYIGTISDGWLVGRGTADEKGAIAAVITMIKALQACGIQLIGDLHVHAVADEEAGSRYGTKYLIQKGYVNADMGVVMEGSTFDQHIHVRTAVRGLHWVEVSAKGKAAHSSRPLSGVNAVLSMAKILLALDQHVFIHTPHALLPTPTIAAGTMIRGGIKENVIPEVCRAVCDIRTIPGMTEASILDEIRGIISETVKGDQGIRTSADTRFWWPASEINEDETIVTLAKKATETVVGYQLTPIGTAGSNDAAYLNTLAHVPTIAFGPGDQLLSRSHGADERIEIQNLVNFAKIYGLMAMDACGVVL
jgi:acetylornithine deacetylase/succinyl-diaminopimelate desuccinylase family protein